MKKGTGAAGGHTAIERTTPIIVPGNAFSVSLASVPDAVAAVFGFIRGAAHTPEERASLCRYFGGMNEPGTRIRVRSMNHSANTVDVDAKRERDTQTHSAKEKERFWRRTMLEQVEREKEGQPVVVELEGWRGWMHPPWRIYDSSSPVAGVEYAGAGVLKSGGGCGRVPITRRG